jgi:hypothetical protein
MVPRPKPSAAVRAIASAPSASPRGPPTKSTSHRLPARCAAAPPASRVSGAAPGLLPDVDHGGAEAELGQRLALAAPGVVAVAGGGQVEADPLVRRARLLPAAHRGIARIHAGVEAQVPARRGDALARGDAGQVVLQPRVVQVGDRGAQRRRLDLLEPTDAVPHDPGCGERGGRDGDDPRRTRAPDELAGEQ